MHSRTAETRWQASAANASMGRLKFFTALYISVSDHENILIINLGVMKKFYSVRKFASVESINKNKLYLNWQSNDY